jgi:hypothetical protein
MEIRAVRALKPAVPRVAGEKFPRSAMIILLGVVAWVVLLAAILIGRQAFGL